MERWEVVEHFVLVVVGIALLGLCARLGFVSTGPERFVWLACLAPCTYWVFWQAFYEDKLESGEPPTTAERAMWMLWLWSRRIVLGGVAALSGVTAFGLLERGSIGLAAFSFLFAAMAAWVAAFGCGRHKSASDDRSVHNERTKRYK